MVKQKIQKILSVFLAFLMSTSTVTPYIKSSASAASSFTLTAMQFPRQNDTSLSASDKKNFGSGNLKYFNGYRHDARDRFYLYKNKTTNEITYCIEPGAFTANDTVYSKGKTADEWVDIAVKQYKNADANKLSEKELKGFIGRILYYGYTGSGIGGSTYLSTASNRQNVAETIATQVLLWETVVGERDADFRKMSNSQIRSLGYDPIMACLNKMSSVSITGTKGAHGDTKYTDFKALVMSYYDYIEEKVQTRNKIPSFTNSKESKAKVNAMKYDAKTGKYSLTLTDSKNVSDSFSYSCDDKNVKITKSANKIVITSSKPVSEAVIKASKSASTESFLCWYADNRQNQIVPISATEEISGFLKVTANKAGARIIKVIPSDRADTDAKDFLIVLYKYNSTSKSYEIYKSGITVSEGRLSSGTDSFAKYDNKYSPYGEICFDDIPVNGTYRLAEYAKNGSSALSMYCTASKSPVTGIQTQITVSGEKYTLLKEGVDSKDSEIAPKITLEEGKTVTVCFKNEYNQVPLIINKTDSDANALPDIGISVSYIDYVTGKAVTKTGVTNSNGALNMMVTPGYNYVVTELLTSDQLNKFSVSRDTSKSSVTLAGKTYYYTTRTSGIYYQSVKNGAFTTSAASVLPAQAVAAKVSFMNNYQTGSISVKKTIASDSSGSVSGWYFLLKGPDGKESLVGPTNSSGDITVNGKTPGLYTLTELLTSSQHGLGWSGDTNTAYKSGSVTYYKTTNSVTKNVLPGGTAAFTFENTKALNTAIKVIKKLTVVRQKPEQEVPKGVKILRTDNILGTKFVTYMETVPVKLFNGGQLGLDNESGEYIAADGIIAKQGIWFKLCSPDNFLLYTPYSELLEYENAGDLKINKTTETTVHSLVDMKTMQTISYNSSQAQYVYLLHTDANGNPVKVDGSYHEWHKLTSGESFKVYSNIKALKSDRSAVLDTSYISPEFFNFYALEGQGSNAWRERIVIRGVIGKTNENGELVFSNLPESTGRGYELYELNDNTKDYVITQRNGEMDTVITTAKLSDMTDPHVTRISDISYTLNGRKEYLSQYQIASNDYGTYSSYHLASGGQYAMEKIFGIPTKVTQVGKSTTAAKMNAGTLPSNLSGSMYSSYTFSITDSTTNVVYNNDEKWTEVPVTKSMINPDGSTSYPEGVVLQLAVDDPLTGITDIRYAKTDKNGIATFRYVPASSAGNYIYRLTEVASPVTVKEVSTGEDFDDGTRFVSAMQIEAWANAYTRINKQNGKTVASATFIDTINKLVASDEPIDTNDGFVLAALILLTIVYQMFMGIGNYTATIPLKWSGQFDTTEMKKFYQGDTSYGKSASEKTSTFTSNLDFNKTTQIINERRTGRLVVKKSTDASDQSEVSGITFRLQGTSIYGEEVDMTAVTNEYGYAVFENVPISACKMFDNFKNDNAATYDSMNLKYTLTEVSQSSKYLPVSSQEVEIYWNRENETIDYSIPGAVTYGAEFVNITKKFNIELQKNAAGNETAGHSLEGAVYGLYKVNAFGDELLETLITDAQGKAVSSQNYEYGDTANRYYVKEIEAPEGFTVDTAKHYISTDASKITKELTTEKITLTENLMKGYFKLHKTYEMNQKKDLADEAGAEFDVYPARYESFSASPSEFREHIVTDADGIAVTKALPLGEYIIHQTKGAAGTKLTEDFSILIKDDKPVAYAETYEIINEALSAMLKIEKKDSDSDKTVTIAGAGFSIYAPGSDDPVEMSVFEEQEDLVVYSRVIHGRASNPLISEQPDPEDSENTIRTFMKFGLFSSSQSTLSEENAIMVSFCGEDGNFSFENVQPGSYKIATIDSGNDQIMEVTVTSSGGSVTGSTDEITACVSNEETYIDRDPVEKKETVFFTDETGVIILPQPLVYGNGYRLVEVQAPEGYELDTTPVIFNVGEEIQKTGDTDTQMLTVIKEDRPINACLKVIKTDSEYPGKKLEGAVFTVYTDKNSNGLFDSEDSVYGIMHETEPGIHSLSSVPYGSYLVRETKAPVHYMKDNNFYPVTVTQSKEYIVSNDTDSDRFENDAEKIILRIKKSSWNGAVKGFSFLIECKELSYREIFTTGDDGNIAVSLREGTYTVSEVRNAASRGYMIPNPVTVTLSYENSDQTIEMYNGKSVDTGVLSSGGVAAAVIAVITALCTSLIPLILHFRRRGQKTE